MPSSAGSPSSVQTPRRKIEAVERPVRSPRSNIVYGSDVIADTIRSLNRIDRLPVNPTKST